MQVPHNNLKGDVRNLQVKSGIATWALLYCKCRYNVITTIVMCLYDSKNKIKFSVIVHNIATIKLWQ